jgi:hypothetical protein
VTRTLRVTNREADRDVSLQCTFERRAHLAVSLDACVLRPGAFLDVAVTFTPRAAAAYVEEEEAIPFEVNGLHTGAGGGPRRGPAQFVVELAPPPQPRRVRLFRRAAPGQAGGAHGARGADRGRQPRLAAGGGPAAAPRWPSRRRLAGWRPGA